MFLFVSYWNPLKVSNLYYEIFKSSTVKTYELTDLPEIQKHRFQSVFFYKHEDRIMNYLLYQKCAVITLPAFHLKCKNTTVNSRKDMIFVKYPLSYRQQIILELTS